MTRASKRKTALVVFVKFIRKRHRWRIFKTTTVTALSLLFVAAYALVWLAPSLAYSSEPGIAKPESATIELNRSAVQPGVIGNTDVNAATDGMQAGVGGSGSGTVALSLQEAIQLALKNNLTTKLADERKNEADGQWLQSLAALLPNLSGTASQLNRTRNLASDGLTFGGISPFLKPFNSFDARVQLVQTLFNLSSIRQFQASRANVNVVNLQEQLSRQQVTGVTDLAYLETLRANRAVDAAQANLDLSLSLQTLARDQHDSGIATGLDVTRAETRVADDEVKLAQAETAAQQAHLQLLRIVGLPLNTSLTLTDPLRFTNESFVAANDAIALAEQDRVDLRIAEEQVRLAEYQEKAAQGEWWPSLEFVGDYGPNGITPSEETRPTREFGVRLNVPIFNGGLTLGRIEAASSRKRQADMQLTDLHAQVEQDVRLALQSIGTATKQVRAADESLRLAQQQLQMARDRFASGLADNIEIVTAQTELTNARDAQVNALAQYNAARINFAVGLGRVESFQW